MARALSTAEGTRSGAFGPVEWGLFASVALVFGSSFLFMAVGLDHFSPGLVTFLRILFGASGLVWFRAARQPVDRADLPRVALLAFVWMALPLSLFPIAQQWIDSSVAGMINGAMPLSTALVATIMLRRAPGPAQAVGLVVGFAGVVAISLPSVWGAEASPLGVGLVVVAVLCYGVALNVVVPLQQQYGGLAIMFRVQLIALVMTAPYGLASVPSSEFSWKALGAMVLLGLGGTALAFVALTNLSGRVGATRGAVPVYFTPVVAIVLGAAFLDESIAALAIGGTALVMLGAALTSRAQR